MEPCIKVFRRALRVGGAPALAVLCACAAAPGEGPHTLTVKRATVTGPAQCDPKPTPQGGIGCEWVNTAGNRLLLTLDEQQARHPEPATGPAGRLASAVSGFNATVSKYPGFEGMTVAPLAEDAGPGAGWACASYIYSQKVTEIPDSPGLIVQFRGLGRICIEADGPPDPGWLVIAELGEFWSPNAGGAPSAATPDDAKRILSTLRIR